jgi:uncharacterized membrane protein YdjX (TVP38/TMEM64 family)
MPSHYRLWGVLAFLAALLLVFQLSGLRQHFSLEVLHQAFSSHLLSGTVVFVLLFCLGNLVQVPGWVFLAAAVLALGRLWGGLVTCIAANIACLTTYGVVHLLGGDALMQLKSKLARRILASLHARPVGSIAALRLLFQTLPAVNVALALAGVRLRDYLLGTLLGLPLPIALYCLFFDYLAARLGIGFHG